MKFKKRCQRLERKQAIWDRETKNDSKLATSTKRPGSTKKC
jgi:hypothetical protein